MPTGIGCKIKYFRMKQKLTQEELAEGIVSVSYLSKIERNSADPNPTAVKQLCERLNINPERVIDDNIAELVNQWTDQLLSRNLAMSHDTYQKIERNIEKVIDADLFWLVELHTLYYFILTDQRKLAERKFKFLEQDTQKFSKEEFYFWLKFSSHFYYMLASYEQAFNGFIKAEKLFSRVFEDQDEEYYDLVFQVAKTASLLHYTYHSTMYADRALDYYRENYKLGRAAKCHILKGTNFKRMREMDEALHHFETSQDLAERLKDKTILYLVYEAMGELFYDQHLTTQALDYYMRSYDIVKHSYTLHELKAILGLIKTEIQLGELEQAAGWHEKGLIIIEETADLAPRYVYQLRVLYFVIHGYDKAFETLLQKEVLPYFKARSLHLPYAAYLKLLADYYYSQRKYKQSAEYYNEAHKALNDIRTFDNQ
ncbi:helix-turn-helix protein [Streptohalobacillus salinus]|uniref:Helix-turn-helix protein n=1 Tax=Streptohalobacillus salinus TaxID=621096 RepID=A0A2V3WEU4_9BACI|nr:helix-turn-helix domain-containing protein [Streptohalobacillus salinus]PXW92118.1 helix-turn-helix protein [Streptohalobacillus salinus]